MINVKNIGQHLGRERHENGWVEKIGKRVKKWRGYYHIYDIQPDGREKRCRRKVLLGECARLTKGDAEEKLRDVIKVARGQRLAEAPEASVTQLCNDYFRLRKGDWSENNRGTLSSVFNLIKAAVGDMEVGKVRADDLKAFVNSLPDRRWKTPKGRIKMGCSESYAKKCITYLRAIFDLTVARGMIGRNPARDPIIRLATPKQAGKPNKDFLSFDGVRRLLDQLDAEDHLIIHIELVCAPRPNETFALRRNDVGAGWLRIDESLDRRRRPKDPKTASSKANVSVPPLLQRELGDWMHAHPGEPEDLLFPNRDGRPKNRQNELNRMLKPAAARAGLGNVTFQMLRRTYSTLGQTTSGLKDIQGQMRHARPDTTAGIYMQTIPAQQADSVRLLEEMIFEKPQEAAGPIQ
jgi:integrase